MNRVDIQMVSFLEGESGPIRPLEVTLLRSYPQNQISEGEDTRGLSVGFRTALSTVFKHYIKYYVLAGRPR